MWSPGAEVRQVSDPVIDAQPFAVSYSHQVFEMLSLLCHPCVVGAAVFLQGKLLLGDAASTSFSCRAFCNSDK